MFFIYLTKRAGVTGVWGGHPEQYISRREIWSLKGSLLAPNPLSMHAYSSLGLGRRNLDHRHSTLSKLSSA